MLVDGAPISASLFDFGMYLFHSGAAAIEAGSGPYLYLAKLESHHEARLWNDVFVHAQAALGIPRGTIRATVLIETILAAFEMDEILHELREHAAGPQRRSLGLPLQRHQEVPDPPRLASPDRAQLTMTVPFMRAYTELLVRRATAAARTRSAGWPRSSRTGATRRSRTARWRESATTRSARRGDGFDGTWVAHPDLVPLATEVFDGVLGDRPNQKERMRDEVAVTAADLLDSDVAGGAVTVAGVRANVRVALAYLDSWLRGVGAAAIDNLMEDAATAEISRSQLWLWVTQAVVLDDGAPFSTRALRGDPRRGAGPAARPRRSREGRLAEATDLLDRLVLGDDFAEFLTLRAYAILE